MFRNATGMLPGRVYLDTWLLHRLPNLALNPTKTKLDAAVHKPTDLFSRSQRSEPEFRNFELSIGKSRLLGVKM